MSVHSFGFQFKQNLHTRAALFGTDTPYSKQSYWACGSSTVRMCTAHKAAVHSNFFSWLQRIKEGRNQAEGCLLIQKMSS